MRLGIYKMSYLYKSGKRRDRYTEKLLLCSVLLIYAVLEVISDPTQLVDNSTALVVSRTVMMSIYPFLFLAETSAATELLYLMALKKVG